MKIIKNNNIIFSIFLFHALFIQIFANYIILPFSTKRKNSSSFFSETNYYTLLSIGQPKKTIEMQLLLSQYNFYLGNGLCLSNSSSDYIPYESKTFKNYSDYNERIGNIKNATNATENYYLYINDLNLEKNITIKDIQFFYGTSALSSEVLDKEKICGIIGLNLYYIDSKFNDNNFIKTLKQKNIVSFQTFSFVFYNNNTKNTIFSKNNNNDNFLIIGKNESEISKLFNTNDLRSIKTTKDSLYC